MSVFSRRRALAGAAMAAIGAGAARAAQPAPALEADAKLIEACGRFLALQRRIASLFATPAETPAEEDERDAAVAPFNEQQEPLLARICAIRATTLEGQRARVECLLAWDGEIRFEAAEQPDEYRNERLIAAVLRDLMQA